MPLTDNDKVHKKFGTRTRMIVSPQESPQILIVEDDQSIRDALDLTFELLGIPVSWATSGADSLRKVQGLRNGSFPTLVVVDGRLPDIHGLELIRDLKKLLPVETEFYMFSAEAGLKQEDLLLHGIAGLIRKPFDTERLLDLASRHALTDRNTLESADNLLASCVR